MARELARQTGAVYLRIDTIEQALRDAGEMPDPGTMPASGPPTLLPAKSALGPQGNRRLRQSTSAHERSLADSARQSGVDLFEVEVRRSDPGAHQLRVERRGSDIPGLKLPTWPEVLARDYEPWDREHLLVDSTVSSIEEMAAEIRRLGKLGEQPE